MRTLFIILLSVNIFAVRAQTLEGYIDEGLKNNLVLQQRSISYEKAMLSLKIANGMFLPSLGVIGNYTHGDGGRSISLPVGDLMNPVYATLNALTETTQFPQIENVEENFFPKNFYDLRVRASVPLINSNLVFNKKLQSQQLALSEFELQVYKRDLVKNIKNAYYQYAASLEAIKVYEAALDRAHEMKKVNESLLKNGSGLQAYVLRSESEIQHITAQLADARSQSDNALAYFNFLLNRESSSPVSVGEVDASWLTSVQNLMSLEENTTQREELRQIRQVKSLNETALKSNQFFWSPKLSGFIDVGSQASNWEFDNKSRYYLVGVQMDIPLFAGFTNRHRISQSKLDVKSASLNETVVTQQLNMSARVSQNALRSAYENYLSAVKQLEAAESYSRLIDKGFRQGVNTFIETIDARNQLTAAQLQLSINQYRTLIAMANLERETASYVFN